MKVILSFWGVVFITVVSTILIWSPVILDRYVIPRTVYTVKFLLGLAKREAIAATKVLDRHLR